MNSITITNRQAFLFTVVFILLISGIFWNDRYQALVHRAADVAAGTVILKDKLSPDAGLAVNAESLPYAERTWNTFLNWAYTNRKGMSFGIALGAAVMTLLKFLSIASARNPYVNALQGMIAGTPLGVCSNCVAPIVKGVAESGLPRATALAMMFASPTLNIIVVSMAFAAFPLTVALTKLTSSLILILLVVPFLDYNMQQYPIPRVLHVQPPPQNAPRSSFVLFVKTYLYYLWYIVKWTLPFMALGGFLGAAVANTIDISTIARENSLLALLGLSVLSTFLPVPMAFDVMVAQALYVSGVPLPAVTVVLTTLGTFSIFSFMICWQTFGRSLALKLFAAVSLIGFLSGLFVMFVL